eukprot:scaffold41152_cov65-Phaeocystis_antarctica.AAC.4
MQIDISPGGTLYGRVATPSGRYSIFSALLAVSGVWNEPTCHRPSPQCWLLDGGRRRRLAPLLLRKLDHAALGEEGIERGKLLWQRPVAKGRGRPLMSGATPGTGGGSGGSGASGGACRGGGCSGDDGAATVLRQPRAILPALTVGVREADSLPPAPPPQLCQPVTKPGGSRSRGDIVIVCHLLDCLGCCLPLPFLIRRHLLCC